MDDWTRRQFVRGVGFGAMGLGLPGLLRARPLKAKARSCIMIFLFGGPSHVDTWDMKPDAPAEYRGEFKPIATSLPGVRVCEHLPRTAGLMHRVNVVRSVTMTGLSIGDHHADTYFALTGCKPDRSFFVEGINRPARADDRPFLGCLAGARLKRPGLPGVVQLPARSGEVTGYINPGQFAGMLGSANEPLLVRGSVDKPRELLVPGFALPAEIDAARLRGRRGLSARLDAWQRRAEPALDTHQREALALLTSAKAKRAFDLAQEPERLRARYGPGINAQSVLMARRLVEAGVPFVCVHWIGKLNGASLGWDTHHDNFGQLKNDLLPAFDACYSALLEDLRERGTLDSTLVVVNAEMGRTPKVGDPRTGGKGPPGRDHWIHCMSALLAGAGVAGGTYGASDRVGGYPAEKACGPDDVAATVYAALGIGDTMVSDRLGRPIDVREGRPLPIFG